MKKAIAEHYDSFKSQKFIRSVLEKNEDLDNLTMSRLMLTQCIKYARLVYNKGQYQESMKMINILYALATEASDILNLIWAKLVFSGNVGKRPCVGNRR